MVVSGQSCTCSLFGVWLRGHAGNGIPKSSPPKDQAPLPAPHLPAQRAEAPSCRKKTCSGDQAQGQPTPQMRKRGLAGMVTQRQLVAQGRGHPCFLVQSVTSTLKTLFFIFWQYLFLSKFFSDF